MPFSSFSRVIKWAKRIIKAKEKSNPDASAIYVPGNQTAQAIEEAIEAEIPLVVAVAEHVPVHDMLRVCIAAISSTSRPFLIPVRFIPYSKHNPRRD